jgi:sugar phosphate isomerase/epimerase
LEIGARQLTEKRLEQYLQLADTFQSPLVRFVIDDAGYEPDASTVTGLLKNVVGYLGKKKIKLGIENHDRFKAKELAFIMESVGDKNVGVCLDCANSLGAGEGIDYVSGVLAPYTINLHIKDYKIERLSHKMGFLVQGCPAGKGMTDVPRLLDLLSAHGHCDSAILEQWVVPEGDIDETVDKENRWADEGIHYLKTIFKN